MAQDKNVDKIKRKLIGFVGGERGSISKVKALAVGGSLVGAAGLAQEAEAYEGGDWGDNIGDWAAYNDGHTHTDSHSQAHSDTSGYDDSHYDSSHTENTNNQWDNNGEHTDYTSGNHHTDLGTNNTHTENGGHSDGGHSDGGHSDGGYNDTGHTEHWEDNTNTKGNNPPSLSHVDN